MAWLSCAMAVAAQTEETAPALPEPQRASPLLTLGSPMLRSTMDWMKMSWLYPSRIPDFRLKVERPEWGPLTTMEMENRLRGVEVRLPMEGLWVGYETTSGDETPRATFSIQRGF